VCVGGPLGSVGVPEDATDRAHTDHHDIHEAIAGPGAGGSTGKAALEPAGGELGQGGIGRPDEVVRDLVEI
jgi:hypothetical protein